MAKITETRVGIDDDSIIDFANDFYDENNSLDDRIRKINKEKNNG